MSLSRRNLRGLVFGTGIALIAALVCAVQSDAATSTAALAVSASVAANCTVSTAPLAFGAYDPLVGNASANLDGTGTITVACTKGAASTIGLSLGNNATGGTRRMTDGASNYLTYEMYQDSGRSTVWGNSGAALLTPATATSKTPRNFTVYGRIPGSQDIPAGNYTDTVTATVNF